MNAGTVTVCRALVYAAGKHPTIESPKSSAGSRTITLPESAKEQLRHPSSKCDEDFIFLSAVGTHPTLGTLRKALHGLCDRAGVPRVSPHALRHTHAAILASSGVDPHSLRVRMGHSQVSTTMNIYAYAMRPDHLSAAAFEHALQRDAGTNRIHD
jgi:integrase